MIFLNGQAKKLASKSFMEFCKSMKIVNGTNKVTSIVIDGICNDQVIANNFQNNYKDLYNSVDNNNLDNVVSKVNNLVTNQYNNDNFPSSHWHKIAKDLAHKAIDNMKNGKEDETLSFLLITLFMQVK